MILQLDEHHFNETSKFSLKTPEHKRKGASGFGVQNAISLQLFTMLKNKITLMQY